VPADAGRLASRHRGGYRDLRRRRTIDDEGTTSPELDVAGADLLTSARLHPYHRNRSFRCVANGCACARPPTMTRASTPF
jgi:hypothetical protein